MPAQTDRNQEPLPGLAWVHEAYRRGYILRARDYARLVPNQILLLVPVDYACHRRREGAGGYGHGVLSAPEFFGPFITTVVASGEALLDEPYGALDRRAIRRDCAAGPAALCAPGTPLVVPNQSLAAEWDPPREGLLLQFPYVVLADADDGQAHTRVMGAPGTPGGPQKTSWSAEPGFPDWWLTNGSGDGWTRFMLWDDVARMPPVYERNLAALAAEEAEAIVEAENEAEERLARQLRAGRPSRFRAGSLRVPH
jgi:hypothetical protein